MLKTAVATVVLLVVAFAAPGQSALDPLPDPADLNRDGHVDFADLVIVLAAWSTPGHGCDGVAEAPPPGGTIASGICNGDVNGDHVVDFTDLVIVLANWTG